MKLEGLRANLLDELGLSYHSAAHLMLNIELGKTGLKLIDLVYAAGYLDAEGCFRFHGTPVVSISNTYPYTLLYFQRLFNGSFRERKDGRPNRRNTFEWSCTGDNARKCVHLVYPFLQEKQRQAEILIKLSSSPPRSARRAALIKELKTQKRIDYHLKETEVNAWTRDQKEHY